MEGLLAGAEGGNPAADFIAQVATMAERGQAGGKHVSGTFGQRRLNGRRRWEAAFILTIGARRSYRLHERHGLRNQKIAFLLPRHDAAPQAPARPSSAKANARSSNGWSSSTSKIVPFTGSLATPASGGVLIFFRRSVKSCCPSNGRGAAACRVYRSAAAATLPRNRSSEAPSGATATGCKSRSALRQARRMASLPASAVRPL